MKLIFTQTIKIKVLLKIVLYKKIFCIFPVDNVPHFFNCSRKKTVYQEEE